MRSRPPLARRRRFLRVSSLLAFSSRLGEGLVAGAGEGEDEERELVLGLVDDDDLRRVLREARAVDLEVLEPNRMYRWT